MKPVIIPLPPLLKQQLYKLTQRRRHRPRRSGGELIVFAFALLPAGPAVGVGALIPRRGRAVVDRGIAARRL